MKFTVKFDVEMKDEQTLRWWLDAILDSNILVEITNFEIVPTV